MEQKSVAKSVAFEDAIKLSGFGKFNYLLIALSGGLMASAFLELTSVNFILPVAQCDLNLTTSDKGILSAIGYVGVILSSHLWGFLADTRGRRATLIPSLLLAFVFTALSSLVNKFWLLVFFRFLNGFFISCASSTTFAFLGEFHDAINRARVLMVTSIVYSILSLCLPTFAVITINQEWSFYIELLGITYKPWRFFLVICGSLNLICGLVLIFLIPESPKFVFSQGDETETLKILQQIYKMNTGNSIETFEVKSIIKDKEFGEGRQSNSQGFFQFMWSQSVPLFRGSHLRNILTACFLQFSACLTSNGFWTFLPEILNKVSLWLESSGGPATVCDIFEAMEVPLNHTDVASVCVQKFELGTYIHIYEIVVFYGLSYVVMSLLINKAGKLSIILVINLICGLLAFLLMFIQVPSILSYMYVGMVLSGLTISVVNASSVELFPTKMRAMAICISMMMGRLGSTIGSIVIGLVINEHCDLTFLMPVTLLLISAVQACTIPNISKRVK